ncbi:DNA-binding response regulator [Bombilactobacillus bombi]|uniref:DNA-binding response regulator n=1 Tax=Bombilactobacillus bombi TaxID=1303590 RepID=A0A417ZCZ9_9LACO|nr:LytTR family DNA-binding domain-containing protein [Bombilactobacillus bombi]RHW48558.1 DNA-binding response regulator [Bombilactobacillus bombi]
MNIYICEDDPSQRKEITTIIKNYIFIENLDMQVVLSTANPHQVLQCLDNQQGICFLDIDFHSDLNGIELVSQIRAKDSHGYIIFITTHDEMAFETFKYQVAALDFILKDQGDLQSNVRKVFQTIKQQLAIDAVDNKVIAINLNDRVLYLNLNSLTYVETASNHKLLLHSTDKESLVTGDLKELEERLPDNFFRCHKSFLVNLDYLDYIDKKQNLLRLKTGASCLIARRKIKLLEK